MQPSRETILGEALRLPVEDRELIVDELIASLDAGAEVPLHPQWADVVEQRLRDIDEGRVTMVPGDQVMAKLRAITHGRAR